MIGLWIEFVGFVPQYEQGCEFSPYYEWGGEFSLNYEWRGEFGPCYSWWMSIFYLHFQSYLIVFRAIAPLVFRIIRCVQKYMNIGLMG